MVLKHSASRSLFVNVYTASGRWWLAVSLALVFSACGSSGDSSSVTSGEDTSGGADASMTADASPDLGGVDVASEDTAMVDVASDATDTSMDTATDTSMADAAPDTSTMDTSTMDTAPDVPPDTPPANRAPVAEVPTLTPPEPTAATALECATVASDPDNDPVTVAWAWYVNGALIDGATTTRLEPGSFRRDDVVRCEATPFDGVLEGAPVFAEVTIGNTAPAWSPDAVARVLPANPTAATELTCEGEAMDLDGDPLTTTVTWTVGGQALQGQQGRALPVGAYVKGDAVSCALVASDGAASSEALVSAEVTIGDQPPVATTVRVSPEVPRLNDVLTCVAEGNDPDNDAVTWSYAWWLGEMVVAGEVEATLGRAIQAGELWSCRATPEADGVFGAPLASSQVIVGNTPPVARDVVIAPTEPTAADELSCSATVSDPDGDPVTANIAWWIGDMEVGQGATLAAGAARKGQAVVCRVTPNDGVANGQAVTATVTLGDATPIWPAGAMARVLPESPTAATALTCEGAATDADGDALSYTAIWTVEGAVLAGETDATLPVGRFVKGDVVSCALVASDGNTSSEPLASPPITIGNVAPTLTSVVVSPQVATARSELSCDVAATDLDNDALTVSVTWSVSDATTRTLPAGVAVKGDAVTCAATVTDGDAVVSETSAAVIIGDLPPEVAGVTVTPAAPVFGDALTCVAEGGDPDNDAVTWSYAWFRGGEQVVGESQATLGVAIVKGEAWACVATPTADGVSGQLGEAAPVTVGNTPPVLGAVTLTAPDPVTARDELRCEVSPTDVDTGDTVTTTTTWFSVAGGVLPGQTSAVLPAGVARRGDVIGCTATASDGTDTVMGSSSTVTLQDAPPVIASVRVTPSSPGIVTPLTCEAVGSDADGDALVWSYVWRAPGVSATPTPDPVLNGQTFTQGDVISCEATVTAQGVTVGPVPSAEVTVGNTPPIVSVTVTPQFVDRDTPTLVCSATASDPDGEVPTIVGYRWTYETGYYVSGFSRAGGIIGGGPFLQGNTTFDVATHPDLLRNHRLGTGWLDRIFCEVAATDGIDTGVGSGEVFPYNAPPSLVEGTGPPVVEPAEADRTTPLTCTQLPTAIDPEGDAAGIRVQWRVNGALLPGVYGTTLSSGYARGDSVQCEALPVDFRDVGTDTQLSAPRVIGNASPTAGTVSVTGPTELLCGAALANVTFACEVTGEGSDVDGDALTTSVMWLRGGVETGVTTPTYTAETPQNGEQIICRVTWSDGQAQASADGVFGFVQPGPSYGGEVTLLPPEPTVGEALFCTAGAGVDPCGGDVAPTWQWAVDGVVVEGETSDTFVTVGVSGNSLVSCRAVYRSGGGGVSAFASAETSLNPGRYVIAANTPGEGFGYAVGVVGDLSGDGLDDVLITAPSYDGVNQDSGRAYVAYGQFSFGSVSVDSLQPSIGFSIEGGAGGFPSPEYREPWESDGGSNLGPNGVGFGMSASRSSGDFNGDGVLDLIVAAPYADNFRGEVTVISGAVAANITVEEALAAGAATRWSGNAPRTSTQVSTSADGDLMGWHNARFIGDFDGDGRDDIAISVHNAADDNKGEIYIMKGGRFQGDVSVTNLIATEDASLVRLLGVPSISAIRSLYGLIVEELGDVTNDGLADLVVAPNGFSGQFIQVVPGRTRAGSIDLASDPSVIQLRNSENLVMAPVLQCVSCVEQGQLLAGLPVGGGGDVNGDGLADLFFRPATPDGSQLYVLFGREDGEVVLDYAALKAGIGGYVVRGLSVPDVFSYGAIDLIDVDGDGYDDMVVGVINNDAFNSGKVSVIYGGPTAPPATFDELLATGRGFEEASPWPGSQLGRNLATGDINGDGLGDIISGAPFGEDGLGRAMVVLGRDARGVITHRGTPNPDTLTGTGDAEVFLGGRGDDQLNGGGGADSFVGGAGDDTITVSDDTFVRVSGGGGDDRLVVAGGVDLNLVTMGLRVQEIETIDLSAAGANAVTVDERRLFALNPLTDRLVIDGTAEDTVTVLGSGWSSLGTSAVGGRVYLNLVNGQARLLIEEGVQTRIGPTLTTTVFTVPETSAPGDTVATLVGRDPDGASVTFALDDPSGTFVVGGDGAVLLTAGAALNFEVTPQLIVTVTVTDADGLQTVREVTMIITDIDEPPVFDPVATVEIDEQPPPGTLLTTVSAVDPEGAPVTYAVLGENSALITVDGETGEVRVADTCGFDFETNPVPTFEIGVTDPGGNLTTSPLVVELNDVATVPVTWDLTFSLASRPLFDPNFPIPSGLGGMNFDPGPIQGNILGQFEGTIDPQINVDVALEVRGGTYEMRYPVRVALEIPDEIQPGTSVSIASSAVTNPNPRMWVENPTSKAAAILKSLDIQMSGQALCAGSCLFDGDKRWRITENVGRSHQTYPWWSFDEGRACAGGSCLWGFQYQNSWSTSQVTINWDDYMLWVIQQAGLPINRGTLSGGASIPGHTTELNYILWGQDVTGALRADLSIDLKVNRLDATLVLEDGSEIPFTVGGAATIDVPAGADVNGDGAVDVRVRLEPNLAYNSTVTFSSDLGFDHVFVRWDYTERDANGQTVFNLDAPGTTVGVSVDLSRAFEQDDAPPIDAALFRDLVFDLATPP